MHQNPLAYDEVAVRNRYILQHGRDVGNIVADAENSRRQVLDQRHAELAAESAEVLRQISARQDAAGATQAQWQTKIEAAFAPYQALLDAAAADDIKDQSEIAALSERSRSLQARMRSIAVPRLSERELASVAIFNSQAATLARESNVRLPPFGAEPMSEKARINYDARLRS
jgi:hypothetical protein